MNKPASPLAPDAAYLTVRQAAQYLHLNDKKIYALAASGAIPATKVTGKWLFPRRLLDDWLHESAHGGLLTDRLMIAGSDDPLLASAVAFLAAELGDSALVAICPTGTRGGLELLARGRANACGIHWGPAGASDEQHARLLAAYPGHERWARVHMARRRQGVILSPGLGPVADFADLIKRKPRWALRQSGAGSQHFLQSVLHDHYAAAESLNAVATALSERHAASLVARGRADCAPGVQSAAQEFALGFLPLGWEMFDLVVPRPVVFARLFQRLLDLLAGERLQEIAAGLGGYDLTPLGRVLDTAQGSTRAE